MSIEVQAFVHEAIVESHLPIVPNHPNSARLLFLSLSIFQLADGLIGLLDSGEMSKVESLYCELSCAVSEFRHLRSVHGVTCAVDAEWSDREQRLPNELVLQSLQFVDMQQSSMFSQLCRATLRLSLWSPACMSLNHHQFFKCALLPRPHRVGCADIDICQFSSCAHSLF